MARGLGIRGISPLGAAGMIVVGAVLVVLGVTSKKFYGFRLPNRKLTDQELDPLGGRIFFCAIGGALLLLGLLSFIDR